MSDAWSPESWAADVFLRQALSDLHGGLDPLMVISAASAVLDDPSDDETDDLLTLAASYAGDL